MGKQILKYNLVLHDNSKLFIIHLIGKGTSQEHRALQVPVESFLCQPDDRI